MINVKFKGEELSLATKKQTQDIISEIANIKNVAKDKLLLNYNSINISPHSKFCLDDIGFSLNDTINVEDYEVKKGYFRILPFNFIEYCDIDKCTNIFSIKKHFAKDFFTVPKNIIIKFKSKKLSDDLLLFEYIDQNIPFEIEVEQGYTLYYTYYGQFRFICMTNESTLEDLEDTISIYNNDNINEIKNQFSAIECENKKKMLQELSNNIQLFKFEEDFSYFKIENNEFDRKIQIFDNHKELEFDLRFSRETNVYSLTCCLERYFGIERKLFIPYNEKDEQIGGEVIVNQNQNINLKFKISSNLKVKISGTNKNLSYLCNINDIKEMNDFENKNFGIIINNQFACCENEKDKMNNCLLVNFLNSSSDPLTEIKILKSKNSCHEKKFIRSSEKGTSTHYFLIPDDMPKDQIAIKYFGMNKDAIEFNPKNFGFIYKYTTSRTINLDFIDERMQKWLYQFIVKKEHSQPKVIDLITDLFKYRTKWLTYKNLKYKVSFDQKELNFYTNLSSIPYDNTNIITIEEKKIAKEDEGTATFIKIPGDYKKDIQLNPNLNTQDFLIENKLQGYDLYMNFNKLDMDHVPYICYLENPVLIANKTQQKNTFKVTNRSLEIRYTCNYKDYYSLASQIKIAYGIEEYDDVKFKLRFHGDYYLPPDFHAGSIPEESLIIVKYKSKEDSKILISYKKEKIIQISDFKSPISKAKKDIMKSLGLYDISKKALRLSFYKTELSEDKSFSYYRINSKMKLYITKSIDSFPIIVSTKDQVFEKEYYFTKGETIKNLKQHLKLQFNIKDDITITDKNGDEISDDINLQENMQIYFSTKLVTILYQGFPKDNTFQFDQIVRIGKANNYINSYIYEKLHGSLSELIYIYTYNETEKCYEIADFTKTLGEYEGPLYAHRSLPDFSFFGYHIRYNSNNDISDHNTLGWFKKVFIAKKAKTNPDELIILQSSQPIDESTPMKDLMKNIQLQIKFKDENSDSETKEKPKTQNKKASKRYGRNKFKPKTKRCLSQSEHSNRRNKKQTAGKFKSDESKHAKGKTSETDSTDNNDDSSENKKRTTKDKRNSNEQTNNAKSKRDKRQADLIEEEEEEETSDPHKKEAKSKGSSDSDSGDKNDKNKKQPKNTKHKTDPEEKTGKSRKKKDKSKGSHDSDTDTDSDETSDEYNPKKAKATKQKNNSDEIKDEKADNKNKKQNKSKETKSKAGSNSSDEPEEDESESNSISIEEEEEELSEKMHKKSENDFLTCSFQIARKTPFTISFNEKDTIEDAKEKLSEREGGIDINCISIVFAGKKLKNNLFIKKLELQKKDILQVFIFTPETILLKSARCFRSHGRQEFDYYSDYEEDQDLY